MSSQLASEGVHVIGDLQGDTALCSVARDMASMFQALGVPLETLDLPISPGRMKTLNGRMTFGEVADVTPRSGISLIAWNGDINPVLAEELPISLFQSRRIVGTWYWETEILPPSLAKGYDLVDEVWVTSRFIADSLSKTSPVPIRHFPHLLNKPKPAGVLTLPPALSNDRFVFLFCFDFRSVSKRKNPHGVCEAFIQAFPSQTIDGPVCVIKSIGGRSHHWLEFTELTNRFSHRSDILFFDGWLPVNERDSLMQRADCYVSLHRAEGLGLTMMECMSLGKPCIATAYSGNMDFMDEHNSWLVPFEKTLIGEGAWPYPPMHEWVEPDLEAASQAMLEAVSNPSLLHQKGLRSAETIALNHGLQAVGTRIVSLLDDLLTRKPRVKPAFAKSVEKVSGRKKAAQLLKQTRELHKKARKDCRELRGMFVPSEVKELMKSMLKIISLQQEAQRETLKEVSQLSSRIQLYHDATFSRMVKDQELTTKILVQNFEPPTAPTQGPVAE